MVLNILQVNQTCCTNTIWDEACSSQMFSVVCELTILKLSFKQVNVEYTVYKDSNCHTSVGRIFSNYSMPRALLHQCFTIM